MRFFSILVFAAALTSLFLFDTACSYTLKIKDGRTAYNQKRFAESIPLLQSEFGKAKTRTEKGQLAYLLADAFRRIGQDEKSLTWYQTAYENNFGPDALKGSAFALKKLERYKEAAEVFKNLGIEIGSPYEFRKELTACTIATDWLKQAPSSGYTLEAAPFNSPQNDFSPIFSPDGRLVFSSDRALARSNEDYAWTGNKFMDLFIVETDGASPQQFDNLINSQGNDGTACFSKSGLELYFVRAVSLEKYTDAYCRIYAAERTDNGWSTPVPLPFQKEKINYLHPALSVDGNTLYFACNDPEGWGGYDLYAVNKNRKSESGWDEPKLLSRNINSAGNELFPTVDHDTLYFASDGIQGMGGLDIFKTFRVDKGAWAPPLNLKAPINSGADDFGLIVKETPLNASNSKPSKPGDLIRTGFLTSNRPGGKGEDDIYKFEQRVPPPKPPAKDTTTSVTANYKIILEGYVLEKILANPDDPNSKLLGRKPLSGAAVTATFGSKKQPFTVKEDGYFKMELSDNTDYNFTAALAGYLSNSTRFSTKGIARDPAQPVQTFEIEIVLDKIYRNQEIILENIYYDYDKWDIRPDAEPTLNRLADMLRQNPGIKIQLGSHTDCRGNEGYNQELSQRRAQSAVTYLIGKGINADRLSAVGYGENQPAVSCNCSKCTEAEHQANRRTTFKVVE